MLFNNLSQNNVKHSKSVKHRMFYTFGQQANNAMKSMFFGFWRKNAKNEVSRQTSKFEKKCETIIVLYFLATILAKKPDLYNFELRNKNH